MAPQPSSPSQVVALLPKLNDADSDIRYMSLNDLYNVLQNGAPNFLISDYHTCAKAVEGLLKTLDDQNGEVQNQAIRCLGALSVKIPADTLPPLVEKLSNLHVANSVDNSIRATALRTFITAFSPHVTGSAPAKLTENAYNAVSKVLIPRLVGYIVLSHHGLKNHPPPPSGMLEIDPKTGIDSDAIDVLIELLKGFGSMLQDLEKQAVQKSIMNILNSERAGTVTRKKAVTAISILAIYLPDRLLSAFVYSTIESFRAKRLTTPKRRLLITMVGSLARSIPQRLGPYLKTLAPFILSALSKEECDRLSGDYGEVGTPDVELEELHEAALVALEGFLASCSNEMRIYTGDSIDAALRHVNYDPSIAIDEDEAMGGTEEEQEDELETHGVEDDEEQDYEEEEGMSEEDDLSWKVRRCAAKVLYTIISTRGSGDLLDSGILYDRIAPVLIERFKEREENVRLEILTAMALLIRKTGGGLPPLEAKNTDENDFTQTEPMQSRKRRRTSTVEKDFDLHGIRKMTIGANSPAPSPPPASGPKADLARVRPNIIEGISKILKQNSVLSQQASISLLRDMVVVQNGSLSDQLSKVVPALVNAVKATAGSTSLAAGGAGSQLRIEALQLIGTICDTHSSKVVAPFLGNIIPDVVAAAKEKTFKVSTQAVTTIESIIKVVTHPRSAGAEQQYHSYLASLYTILIDRIVATGADLEVRQRAIRALGVLLSRTSGDQAKTISGADRFKALAVLQDRLKNETTRLAAAQAVDLVVTSAVKHEDLQKPWVQEVVLELAAQLRKADRILRGASLAALKDLVGNAIALSCLDSATASALTSTLLPLVNSNDLNTLGLATVILTKLVQSNPQAIVHKELNKVLCSVVLSPISGVVLDAYLALLKSIGEQGVGKALMKDLLNVCPGGDPTVAGKAIGTLLVAGGSSTGYDINSFVKELGIGAGDLQKCLALSVLGEAGLRLGTRSPLKPSLFLKHFSEKSDTVARAAAVAFGRAGAGNVDEYLPAIMSASKGSGSSQYLSLHSIKELLNHAGETEADISPYTQEIWEQLMSASKAEDNKAMGAECIGQLTIIEPEKFLPLVKAYLSESDAASRGMVIQAIRFTFADSDERIDEVLKPLLMKMLTTMLDDPNLENRRLSLSTFNSAVHNKPDLVLPHLAQLLPSVMRDSQIKPELIREVQMGPFKHKVDDGLEIRKSAYETLYSLMENAYSRISTLDLFDRVIAGLEDEHEIRILCNLMLTKLISLDPDEAQRRLNTTAERLRKVLSFKPKENAVKQELEKVEESKRGALKLTITLNHAFPGAKSPTMAQTQGWATYCDWAEKEHRALWVLAVEDYKNQPT